MATLAVAKKILKKTLNSNRCFFFQFSDLSSVASIPRGIFLGNNIKKELPKNATNPKSKSECRGNF
jgi:hypothetical protein